MSLDLCYYCMKKQSAHSEICPHCGKRNLQVAAVQKPYALPCGTLLHNNKYVIGRVLGEGGFGITYIGFDLVLQIRVCIKEYFPAGLVRRSSSISKTITWATESDSAKQASFVEEARNAAQLHGLDAIVQVWDVFYENGTAYIVMSFIEGTTLKDSLMISGNSMDYKACVDLFDPVLAALEEVHKLNIIHRDISPDNLMLRPDGKLMLLDLGAAKNLKSRQREESTRVAKKGFSPPEQYVPDGKIGPWTDVYAITATIYYCVTGKVPPTALERNNGQKLDLSAFSTAAAKVIAKGLAARIEDRYQTVGELREALQKSIRIPRWIELAMHYKASVIAAALAVVCLCGMGMMSLSMQLDRDRQSVVSYGQPNSALINDYILLSFDKVEYYMGADDALYRVDFDESAGSFFLDQGVKLFDGAFEPRTDGEHIFFILRETDGQYLCRMNCDGSGFERLFKNPLDGQLECMQYVKLENGKEYLYVLSKDSLDLNNNVLIRYDLSSGDSTSLAEGAWWYNPYGNTLYYTVIAYQSKEDKAEFTLVRSDLDGKNRKILDTEHRYFSGIVDDGCMILISDDSSLSICDLDGNVNFVLYNGQKDDGEASSDGKYFNIPINFSGTIYCRGGWLYYCSDEDQDLHRLRVDNPHQRETILEGHSAKSLCMTDSSVVMLECTPTDREREMVWQMTYYYAGNGNTFSFGPSVRRWDGLSFVTQDDIYYEVNKTGDGVIVTGVKSGWRFFALPRMIDGLPVRAIGDEAFKESEIVEIGLPDTLTEIGQDSFLYCENLSFVGLPEGLRTIGNGAFGECTKLIRVDLPHSLETLGRVSFAQTGLKEVFIPENVKSIGGGCFAAYESTGFCSITVSPDNTAFFAADGVLMKRSAEGCALVCYPSGLEASSYEVPQYVTSIESYAFGHAGKLTSVIIPDSVTRIKDNAFWETEITQIEVGSDCAVSSDLGRDISVVRR